MAILDPAAKPSGESRKTPTEGILVPLQLILYPKLERRKLERRTLEAAEPKETEPTRNGI